MVKLDSGASEHILGHSLISEATLTNLSQPYTLFTAGDTPMQVKQLGDVTLPNSLKVEGGWCCPRLDVSLLSVTKLMGVGFIFIGGGKEMMGISPDSKVYRFRVDEGGLLAMMPGEANYVNLHNYLTTRSLSPSPASSASLASASESLASEPASSASASVNSDIDCLASVTRLVQKSKHKLGTKGMMLLLLLTVLQGAIGGVPGSPVTSPGGLTLLPLIS